MNSVASDPPTLPAPRPSAELRSWVCAAVATLLLCWAAAPASAGEREPERRPDTVRVTVEGKTKTYSGRLLRQTDPEEYWFLDKSSIDEVKIPQGAQVEVDSLRTRLMGWMSQRAPTLDATQMYALVDSAQGLGLHRMAHLQALATVLRFPDHAQAHEFLGNKLDKKRGVYEWRVGRKDLVHAAYLEYVKQDWSQRIYLESEHYRIQSDAGLDVAVNTLFELEALYLHWMSGIGAELIAAEEAIDLERHKMAIKVFKDRFGDGYELIVNKERPAIYDPSEAHQFDFEDRWGDQTISFNVIYTYAEQGKDRPFELFSLATQQLMWTTLFFSHRETQHEFTFEDRARGTSHWIEIGLGYYVMRTFDGPAGFPVPTKPVPLLEPKVRQFALAKLSSGCPVQSRKLMQEITNLIGLPFEYFYLRNPVDHDPLIGRCKAWTTYLMEASEVPANCAKGGRDALLEYLRQVFGTKGGPTGHSSKLLDSAFEPTRNKKVIERLQAPYEAWLATQ